MISSEKLSAVSRYKCLTKIHGIVVTKPKPPELQVMNHAALGTSCMMVMTAFSDNA
jgi:hypothetical protein